ncbi:MAG: C39 family peptidase [Candidatus Dormibacteria bacterium]
MSRPIVDYVYSRRRRRASVARRRLLVPAAGLALLLLLPAGLGARALAHHFRHQVSASSHPLSAGQLLALAASPVPDATPTPGPTETPSPAIPASALLSVPYSVQAPYGNWKVHEESCEEDALMMYHDFLIGDSRADIPPAEADQQLRALKAWQVQNWGAERDLTIARIGELAAAYWGLHPQVLAATEETIRTAIAGGHPVILPVMTHSLQNPNYGPKTVYHVLVLKGFNAGGVVANDGGVKEGKNWFYAWPVLFGAIDAQAPVMNQGRVMLVLDK